MIIRIPHSLLAALLVLIIGLPGQSDAQDVSACNIYDAATTGVTSKSVPIVPEVLLQNMKPAVPCLVKVIAGLVSNITSAKMPPDAGNKFLSATGALRNIMARQTALDSTSGTPGDNTRLNEFIKIFRASDTIDVVSVLTYGARSDLYDARLNAVLILGNVIDNTTVCVPIAHLNDPEINDTDYGRNGRANLLGIISVVAPWAYDQNYDAIKKTRAAIGAIIDTSSDNQTSRSILQNIDKRLGSQTDKSNKTVNLPDEWRAACKTYIDNYRIKHKMTGNFSY